ncbi:hypothetical protein [Dyella acidiphila]|uniref:Glycosyltransferase RgtA/B/C/D-like domain-containing protein n=1 Tax=Dyella acidiphila TaxID=2775866 RepID=A0ABR9G516_9GAMM|nr:hypothetical protein [Dyella acidiphila]MBE1159146.1 hypothetical protein [Dyella acidiphila]
MAEENKMTASPDEVRSQLRLELLTLCVLMVIAFACVGPLLEEWGLLLAFHDYGLGYIATGFFHTMRPLHLIAYATQWVLGAGHHPRLGVAAATAVFLLLRYFAARWAVSPLLTGHGRWVISTMAAVLVPWDGAWLGRYAPSQLSAVFFFLAFGCVIRLYPRWSVRWGAMCALCVLLLLATYQGLFLCIAVAPFAILSLRGEGVDGRAETFATTINSMVRMYAAIALGGVVYGLYWLVISHVLGADLYEENIASGSGSLFTLPAVIAHVKAVVVTSYVKQPTVLPLLFAAIGMLCWPGMEKLEQRSLQWRVMLLALLCLVLMPLLGLVYVDALHLNDPQRITFPLSAGAVLLAFALLNFFSRRRMQAVNAVNGSMVVLILLINCGFLGNAVRQDAVLQRNVITQALNVVKAHKSRTLVIEDMTGQLGDVYTLYQHTLSQALGASGTEGVEATICTPLSVDRIDPVARRFPISSTPRCEDLPELKSGPKAGVLVTRWNDGALEVVAAG